MKESRVNTCVSKFFSHFGDGGADSVKLLLIRVVKEATQV